MTTQMTTQDRDTRRVARFVAGTFQAVRHLAYRVEKSSGPEALECS
jgi:hypothetical protein